MMKKLVALLFALSIATPAVGQWQVPTNNIPFGRGVGTGFSSAAAAANSILATNGSNVPGLTTTLPTAVQDNITRVGTLTSGALPASLLTGIVTVARGGLGAASTATLNRYLKGDGTNWVTSTGSASGIGACTNQFPRTLNSDAAPTCATVALGTDVSGNLSVSNLNSGSGATANTVWHGNAGWAAVSLTADISGTLGVGNGGTGLTAGISGGIPGYTGTGTLTSSVLLTANALILGGGAGATPTPMASLGTTTTLLHGNAAGQPTFGAVNLATDVSGNLSVSNLNSGSGATANTVWHGNAGWAAVSLSADVTGTTPIGNGGTAQTTAAAARGSSGLNVESFTGHGDSIYTILVTDKTVGTNAAFTASRAWTLPAASAYSAGRVLIVADFQGTVTASNTIVITRAGSDTINGGTSVTINSANGAYALISDGTSKWTAQAIGAASASGVSSLGGLTGAVGVANGIEVSGSNIQVTAARRTLPTTSRCISSGTGCSNGGFGGAGTYTTPANVLWIEVTMYGGGAGGAGSGTTSPGNGTAGGDTCWNTTGAACTTPVYSAGGAALTTASTGVPGAGGAITGSATPFQGTAGGQGGPGNSNTSAGLAPGGNGAPGCNGGAGLGGNNNVSPTGGAANTGAGGGGGTGNTSIASTAGGSAGACLKFIINSPAATYTYAVGAGGTGGATGGGGGQAGGGGGLGGIWILEHYNFLLKRDLNPANDNTPMFLNAVA